MQLPFWRADAHLEREDVDGPRVKHLVGLVCISRNLDDATAAVKKVCSVRHTISALSQHAERSFDLTATYIKKIWKICLPGQPVAQNLRPGLPVDSISKAMKL